MSSSRIAGWAAAFALILAITALGGLTSAQSRKKPGGSAGKPSISISSAPNVPPGENTVGPISGITRNAPKGSKVLIYSYGDTWYVQPYANEPFTEIGKDGKWSATIHGGYKYAAFLVKATYSDPPATTDTLPNVGGNVLASAHARPAK